MYTLKGIFPEPKKEQKKNFIKENMKQLKYIQGKTTKDDKFMLSTAHSPRNPAGSTLGQVKSSPSNKSGKPTLHVGKTSSNYRQKHMDVRIKKGDMAEFLKRKEQRQMKEEEEESADEDLRSTESSGLQDVACQTVETNLSQRLTDSARLTMLYPKKESDYGEGKLKGSGDSDRFKNSQTLSPKRAEEEIKNERTRGRLNSILERKEKDSSSKDPYLPAGYQKGVLPKYLRNRKDSTKDSDAVAEMDAECPSGHVVLPDSERKETLRMLRKSFAELVGELNKMPVKTDTLRMRNRKMELEKQLAKLEEGIKVFSRPKVFVKIGE